MTRHLTTFAKTVLAKNFGFSMKQEPELPPWWPEMIERADGVTRLRFDSVHVDPIKKRVTLSYQGHDIFVIPIVNYSPYDTVSLLDIYGSLGVTLE